MKFLERPAVHLALIALLGLIAYSNTFDVPFQFDDQDYIVNNPLVKDMRYLLNPSSAVNLELPLNVRMSLMTRYIAYLTFSINHALAGMSVKGYHIFNVLIHILNAMLLYFFIGLTLKTPSLECISPPRSVPLVIALLFVSHPLQTQAVTYISQRFTSLAALFYLSSLALYAKWRLATVRQSDSNPLLSTLRGDHTIVLYLLSLLFAVFAMHTKENSFALPPVIVLYELLFFGSREKPRHRILHLMPFALAMLIIPLTAPVVPFGEAAKELVMSRPHKYVPTVGKA